MKDIAVYGAGGFGREVKMLIDQINSREQKFRFIGFFDDGRAKGEMINNFPVLGGIKELNERKEALELVIGIGNPVVKKAVVEKVNNGMVSFPVLIHPSVWVGEDVTFGEGSIICAGCIATVNIRIGKHVVFNLGCTIGHDSRIGNFTSVMPGVNVSGEVVMQESIYVGTGAQIINKLEIGSNTTIGAGAVVTRSLPANCTAVGVPAKAIKMNEIAKSA